MYAGIALMAIGQQTIASSPMIRCPGYWSGRIYYTTCQ